MSRIRGDYTAEAVQKEREAAYANGWYAARSEVLNNFLEALVLIKSLPTETFDTVVRRESVLGLLEDAFTRVEAVTDGD